MNNACVVVFSGGQDSSTCLAAALKSYDDVYTVGFSYGQRHAVKMQCRERILGQIEAILGTSSLRTDTVVPMESFGALSKCALTAPGAIEEDAKTGLPTSFVPGRNLVFLTYAAALAWQVGARDIISGVGQTDYSGYPDCRENTIRALETAINLGMESHFRLLSPLMTLTKGQTWKLAEDTGGRRLVEFLVRETHSCYEGVRDTLHPWGYGCGRCPACRLREAGWKEYETLMRR